MTIREELIKIENENKIEYFNLRIMMEHHGVTINFDHLIQNLEKYRPDNVTSDVWKQYVDLAKAFQEQKRARKIYALTFDSDENIINQQNANMSLLSQHINLLVEKSKSPQVQQYFSLVKDYSQPLEQHISYMSSPNEDEISYRERTDVINTFATNTIMNYMRVSQEDINRPLENQGPSLKTYNELLEILKNELQKIGEMTPAQYREYRIRLMHPTKDEIKFVIPKMGNEETKTEEEHFK